MGEAILHFPRRLILYLAAFLDQLDERARLTDILEISCHHWVQGLVNQAFDVTEALDDQRSLAVVNMHHYRQR